MCTTMQSKAAQAMALGKTERLDWSAQLPATVAALGLYHLFQLFLNPAAGTYPGVALAGQTVTGGTTPSLTSGLLNFLDPTGSDRSYLVYGEVENLTSSVLGNVLFFDLCAYYPQINMNNAVAQVLTGAASILPGRLANGRGVHMMLDVTTGLGAVASNTVVTYTNRLGVGGQVTPAVPMVVSSPQGRVPQQRWLLPLAAGDDGVQSVQGFDLTAAMGAGVAALTLIKPLFSIPLVANMSTGIGVGMKHFFSDPLDVQEVLTAGALSAVLIPNSATANAQFIGHFKNALFNPNN